MKLLLAFLTGAAVAGGIVYLALLPERVPVATETIRPPVLELTPDTAKPAVAEPSRPATSTSVRKSRPAPRPRPFRASEPKRPAPPPLPMPPVVRIAASSVDSLPIALEVAYAAPPPPEPRHVTLAAGTVLNVIISEELSSNKNLAGDLFSSQLDQPLVINDLVIAERGARAEGRVVEADRSGKVKGRAYLVLQLTDIMTADGQKIELLTDAFTKRANKGAAKDVAKIGGAASIGAMVGGIAGGGAGAAIGAAIGGAAGTGVVLATRGAPAVFEAETRIPFRLAAPVTITERFY